MSGDPRGTKLQRIEASIEERLRHMAETGELSGLPGEGARLVLDGTEDERWSARHIARQQKAKPEWVDVRADIDRASRELVRRAHTHRRWMADRAELTATLAAERIVDHARRTAAADELFRAQLGTSVAEVNVLIARFNAIVPVASLQLTHLREEDVLARAATRF